MARHKNSTALFDVIHAAKKPPKSSPSASIPAPRWWGKDKKPLKAVATGDPTENVGKQRSWLLAARQNAAVAPPSVSAAIAPVPSGSSDAPVEGESQALIVEPAAPTETAPIEATGTETPPAVPKPRFIDRFRSKAPKPVTAVEVDTPVQADEPAELLAPPLPVFDAQTQPPEPQPQPQQAAESRDTREKAVRVDRASGDVRFSLSYGGIIAIGFIMLMALAIAFIAGTHAQFASNTDDVPDVKGTRPAAPANSGLMAAVGPTKPTDAPPIVQPDVLAVSPRTPSQSADPDPLPAAPLRIKATRDIGLIFIVIQSYTDPLMAQKACDFVNHHGVECTVVQGLAGWAPRDWYSVVGLKPYRRHDPGLEQDEQALNALGLKFNRDYLNQFQPQGYTWRADSDANNDDR